MKRILILRRICLMAAILWLLFIWSNSLQTASESSQVSLGVLGWFTPLLARIGLSEEVGHALIRKLAHMTEFAVAGMLWSTAISSGIKDSLRIRWMRRGGALLLCLAAAVIDETIQCFVLGRSGELRDVCIDLLGGMLGVIVSVVVRGIVTSMCHNSDARKGM